MAADHILSITGSLPGSQLLVINRTTDAKRVCRDQSGGIISGLPVTRELGDEPLVLSIGYRVTSNP
jgi:hypothetical protein